MPVSHQTITDGIKYRLILIYGRRREPFLPIYQQYIHDFDFDVDFDYNFDFQPLAFSLYPLASLARANYKPFSLLYVRSVVNVKNLTERESHEFTTVLNESSLEVSHTTLSACHATV